MVDPWQVEEADYPRHGFATEKLSFMVNYAVLAPSSHNTQPWRFTLGETHLHLYADRSRRLPVIDPHDRELIISCGAVLGILIVVARYFGHVPQVQILPDPLDPDLLASLALGQKHVRQAVDVQLFSGILARRTTREVFRSTPVPAAMIEDFRRLSQRERVLAHAIQDRTTRKQIAALVAEGDRLQFADPAFREELSHWLRSRRTARYDGVSADGFDVPGSLTGIGALALRTFDIGRGVAARDDEIAAGSPLLLVLASQGDTPEDWLNTGQALMQVLLRAAASDVTASFLNQPLEVPSLRLRLAAELQLRGFPQVLLRMGYSERNRPSARRPVAEVLHRHPPIDLAPVAERPYA